MVLDKQRHRLDWWLVPLAKALRNVNPNVFTWLSLVAALAGGYAFYRSGPGEPGVFWLMAGWSLLIANSVLDLLDGKVAKMTGKQTAKGDYLDHAIDRFSDVAFLLGLTFSPWVRMEVGVLAIVFTLLTSYLGTQAQAVGIGRNYGGLLGRADRMVLLIIVPLVEYFSHLYDLAYLPDRIGWAGSYLELTLMYFAAVGLLTTVQRFAGGLQGFDKEGRIKQ